MKYICFKIKDRKTVLMLSFLIILLFFSILFVDAVAELKNRVTTNAERVAFIEKLGYTPDDNFVEQKQTAIPFVFSEKFKEYNALQNKAGYDLYYYRGESVTVYKYKLKDYTDCEAFITLIIFNCEVIGGDVSSHCDNGFTYPLNNKNENQT